MKFMLLTTLAVVPLLALPSLAAAAERGKLIFEDSFERSESQEINDEIGNGWGSNSKKRAGGNKQVDLRDGAMYIFMHETADHAVSVTHEAEFTNGTVELRFMLEHAQDQLGLDFADLQLKTVHAGHLFKVTVGRKKLDILDMKTGSMRLDIRTARQAKQLTDDMKKTLAATKKTFPLELKTGKWYTLAVNIEADALRVTIDAAEVGSFTSQGFAHDTKRMLRLSVPKQAVVDDVKIYARTP